MDTSDDKTMDCSTNVDEDLYGNMLYHEPERRKRKLQTVVPDRQRPDRQPTDRENDRPAVEENYEYTDDSIPHEDPSFINKIKIVPSARKNWAAEQTGKWFVVMFARNRNTEGGSVSRAERTSIKVTSYIGTVLVTGSRTKNSPGDVPISRSPMVTGVRTVEPDSCHRDVSKIGACGSISEPKVTREVSSVAQHKTASQWQVVLAIGPVKRSQQAYDICKLWINQKGVIIRGVIPKAARGEAISSELCVPGYIDWENVFGTESHFRTLYDVQFGRIDEDKKSIPTIH